MITNINTLQNLPEGDKLQTYSDLYLKQSLANLGQRFSVKGDGLQTGEFHIYEMFSNEFTEENTYSYSGINISYADGNYNIVLSYIDNGEVKERLPIEGTTYYTTSEDIELEGTIINAVKYYKSDGVINKTDDNYITTFAGVSSTNKIIEVTCDNFKISSATNRTRLSSGIRIINKDGKVMLSYLYKSMHDADGRYIFNLYHFTDDYITSVQDAYTLLFTNNESGDNFIKGNEAEVSPEYLLQKLIDNKYIEQEDSDTLYTAEKENGDMYFNMTSGYRYSGFVLPYMYDINSFYSFIIEYYNNHVYFANNDNLLLKKQLLVAISKKIYNDFINSSEYLDIDELNLWLPYNYKFVYSCNSNDGSQIYNSVKDISVRYTIDAEKYMVNLYGENSEQVILCDSPDEENVEDKFVVYQYSITYSKDNIVDDIIVEQTYTLPYIDNNGYWCINDTVTNIYARGKDGGQPNVIITYTDTYNGVNNVISSFKRDEITQLDWADVKCMTKPLDNSNNVSKEFYHIMNTKMPTNISYLNENLITFLENALILNINSVNSENYSESTATSYLKSDLGDDGVVPTFWILTKEKKAGTIGSDDKNYEYKFSYVQQPGDAWAVDMNYLSNAEMIVKHYMQFGIVPDNYEHTWLVFDSVASSLKNTPTDTKSLNIWPVIRNYTQADINPLAIFGYTGDSGETISPTVDRMYYNDLNMFVGFFDNIKKSEGSGYITDIGTNLNKYFKLTSQGQVPSVINYARYMNEWVPNSRNDESSANDGLIPVLDTAEVFLRNTTVMNRVNIMSFDADANVYNAYIGVAFDSPIKSILHIGTSNVNPNIGNQTIFSSECNKYFLKQNEISVDFDVVTINGKQVAHGPTWIKTDGPNNHTIYSAIATPELPGGHPIDCTNDDESMNFEKMSDYLVGYRTYTSFPGSSNGNFSIPAKKSNECWLNLTYYCNSILDMNIDTATTSTNPIVGVANTIEYKTINKAVTYFLKLSNDITQKHNNFIYNQDSGASTSEYYTMNPIKITYHTGNPIVYNVREMYTSDYMLSIFNSKL